MNLGSNLTDNFMVGSSQVDMIMLGDNIVWESIDAQRNMVAYYPLDTNSTDAYASYDGIDTGISYNGSSANFDGYTSKIELTTDIPIYTDFTISVWVNRDISLGHRIWSYQKPTELTHKFLFIGADDKALFHVSGSTADARMYSTTSLQTSTDYNIVATCESNVCKLYINGVLEAEDTVIVPENSDTSDGFYLGVLEGGTGGYYDGQMSNMKIYNEAKSNIFIEALYNEGK